jgi:hypothetical protein
LLENRVQLITLSGVERNSQNRRIENRSQPMSPTRRNAGEVLAAEARRLETIIQQTAGELAGIKKALALIDGTESVDPSASSITLPRPNTVKAALVEIVASVPDGLSTPEIVRKAKREYGVESNDRTIASFLSRLTSAGVLKMQDGRYVLKNGRME